MNRLLLLVGVLLVASMQVGGVAATNADARFYGRVHLFDSQSEAPASSHVRARVAGAVCADVAVAPKIIAGETKQSFDITLPAGTCGNEGADVSFEWYRSDPSIATTCMAAATWHAADQRLDPICGEKSEYSATWIVQNTTDQVQRSLEIFPRVVVGDLGVGTPVGCGTPVVHAGSTGGSPFLVGHAEVVFPEPCIPPGAEVRLRLSTDCPCHSELEIQRVVWLAGEPLFKANVDCDGKVDAADALRDLLIAAQLPVSEIAACPSERERHYYPNALGGVWGDVNCDGTVTPFDAVIVLKVALQISPGLAADCWSHYYAAR